MGVIYLVRNKINNKIYFGQTAKSFSERYRNDFPKNTHNDHIKRSIEKYGWENFEVIEEFDSSDNEKELGKLEDLYIKMWNTTDKCYGYNKRYGSIHGKPNEETRKKLSRANFDENGKAKGNKRVKCLDTGIIYDSVKTASQTIGIPASGIAKCCRGEFSQTRGYHFCYVDEVTPQFTPKMIHRQVYCFETGKTYEGYSEAANDLGIESCAVRACCVGTINQAGKYHVCHLEDKDKVTIKKIYCITNNKVYNTAKQAANELGLNATTITHCCRGRYSQTGGYIFKYLEEEGERHGNNMANVS